MQREYIGNAKKVQKCPSGYLTPGVVFVPNTSVRQSICRVTVGPLFHSSQHSVDLYCWVYICFCILHIAACSAGNNYIIKLIHLLAYHGLPVMWFTQQKFATQKLQITVQGWESICALKQDSFKRIDQSLTPSVYGYERSDIWKSHSGAYTSSSRYWVDSQFTDIQDLKFWSSFHCQCDIPLGQWTWRLHLWNQLRLNASVESQLNSHHSLPPQKACQQPVDDNLIC